MAGMACTSGISARLSWVLAALTATASGRPPASVSTCSVEPSLPRSTGFSPVSGPLLGPDTGRVDHRAGPLERPVPTEPGAPRPVAARGAGRARPRAGPAHPRLLTEPVEHRPVQPAPQPGLGPGREAAMGGGRGHAEPRGGRAAGAGAGARGGEPGG